MNNATRMEDSRYHEEISFLLDNPNLAKEVINDAKLLRPNCAGVFSWIVGIDQILSDISKKEVIEHAQKEYGVELSNKKFFPCVDGPGYAGFFLIDYYLKNNVHTTSSPTQDVIVTILEPLGCIDNHLGTAHIGICFGTNNNGDIIIFDLDANNLKFGFREINPYYGFREKENVQLYEFKK